MNELLGYYDMVICEAKTNHKLTTSKQLNTVLTSVIDFYFEKYGLKGSNTRVVITKIKQGLGGYIDISKLSDNNKDNITLKIDKTLSLSGMIRFISHELTHAKQILNNELWYSSEGFYWKGEFYMTIKDYNKILNKARKSREGLYEYIRLPWEVEAHRNEKSGTEDFKNSMQYQSLRDNDDININMILDSL